MNYNQELNN